MVVHQLNTRHPDYIGSTVELGIRMNGDRVNSPEYPYENGVPSASYVVSEPGRMYRILVRISNPIMNHAPRSSGRFMEGDIVPDIHFRIDGQVMGRVLALPVGETVFEFAKSGNGKHALIFDKPNIVTEGGVSDSAATEAIGSIEIRMWLSEVIRSSDEYPRRSMPDRNYSERPVAINERAKKGALISSTTRFGPPISLGKHRSRRSGTTKTHRLTQDPILTHTFHYKTLEFLECEGIIRDAEAVPAAVNANADIPDAQNLNAAAMNENINYNENGDDDDDAAIEFLGAAPVAPRKPVAIVDLTNVELDALPSYKLESGPSSDSQIIDVDTYVPVKPEKVKREGVLTEEVIDLTVG
ncbi:hypothetical protein HDU81_009587 [Chytriomyces hyalinus]|nr:hypothetical protein HDU81_009587 [Chytriomyces hyalinus]